MEKRQAIYQALAALYTIKSVPGPPLTWPEEDREIQSAINTLEQLAKR